MLVTGHLAFYALLLFGAAGTLLWPRGWAFFALYALQMLLFDVWLARLDPEFASERRLPGRATMPPRWDRRIVAIRFGDDQDAPKIDREHAVDSRDLHRLDIDPGRAGQRYAGVARSRSGRFCDAVAQRRRERLADPQARGDLRRVGHRFERVDGLDRLRRSASVHRADHHAADAEHG